MQKYSFQKTVSLTNFFSRSFYNFVKEQKGDEAGILVYKSKDLSVLAPGASSQVDQILANASAHLKYLRLLPFFYESARYHPKHFVTKLELLPKSEALRITCLTSSGAYSKLISINNVIPVIHEDYRAFSKEVLFSAPTFLDNEMIYYNTSQQEFYVFDKEAEWNEEGVNHPLLDIAARFNEKQWLDLLRLA